MGEIKVTFFTHGTTEDNEQDMATGWSSSPLSAIGIQRLKSLRNLIKNLNFDFIFTSDLKRAIDSGELVFGDRYKVMYDSRLRECNYGDLTGISSNFIAENSLNYTNKSYPNGESYKDVEKRILSFLEFVKENYMEKRIAIVAHRATQLAFEVILNKKSWEEAFAEDWRKNLPKAWKPGWDYLIQW